MGLIVRIDTVGILFSGRAIGGTAEAAFGRVVGNV